MKKTEMPFIFLFSFVSLFSCQVQEEICYKPMYVTEPPKEIFRNTDKVYVDLRDLQTVEYVGNFCTKIFSTYEDNEGKVVTSNHFVYNDVYKIRASKYWGWSSGKEYVSSYKELYEISAPTLCSVRERVKDMNAAICLKKVIDDGHVNDAGQAIYAIAF